MNGVNTSMMQQWLMLVEEAFVLSLTSAVMAKKQSEGDDQTVGGGKELTS